MAEVLGVVASGIAVVQMAAQVGEAVAKLVKIWGQIQESPQIITDLLEDLEETACIFAAMEETFATSRMPPHVWKSPTLVQSLARSKAVAMTLRSIASELDEQMKASRGVRRKLANFKAVLKKEFLDRIERKLRRSLSNLQMAMTL